MNQLRMPAEHGAWGILLVPLVCSAAVAGTWNTALLASVICILSLFLLRGSVEAHGSLRAVLLPVHIVLAALAFGTGLALVLYYRRLELIWLAIAGASLFFLQSALLRSHSHGAHNEKRSLAAELMGVALLSLTAPAAWIAGRGSMETKGLAVWVLNLLFFLGGVLYVKYRVRGVLAHRDFPAFSERLGFAWPVLLYHLLLGLFLVSLIFVDQLSVAVAVAFAPGMIRAAGLLAALGRAFPIRRLGWSEVAHAVFFAVALVLAFRF